MDRIITRCKVCPIKCELIITENRLDPSGYTVEGNSCGRGREFAIQEMNKKSRVITGKVLLRNGIMGHLPVKTTGLVPNNRVEDVLNIINSTCITAPVNKGDIIIENVLGLGIDVIAARKVKEAKNTTDN